MVLIVCHDFLAPLPDVSRKIFLFCLCWVFAALLQTWLPLSMWDLTYPTRERTYIPCMGRQILTHWTTRDVCLSFFLKGKNHKTHFSICL